MLILKYIIKMYVKLVKVVYNLFSWQYKTKENLKRKIFSLWLSKNFFEWEHVSEQVKLKFPSIME